MKRRLNCLFIVQGEGRGHITQALALKHILADAGHSVSGVLVGQSKHRNPPRYFVERVDARVQRFTSPSFSTDGDQRAVRIFQTLAKLATQLGDFRASLRKIDESIHRYRPDLVVNFYEPLAGIYYRINRPDVPMVCIAHQYLVHHECYPFPQGSSVKRLGLKFFTDVTSMGAERRLALSFYPASDIPARRTVVIPPLLRSDVFEQRAAPSEPFLLAYILHSGYAEQIIRWHNTRRETVLHCFWDNPEAPEVYSPVPNLSFHQLDDRKFLSMMGRCSGLICTAGFESVCEAMYFDKPVMVVPVEGHIEQACNALDALAAGAGIAHDTFDIDAFLEYLPMRETAPTDFSTWAESAAGVVLRQLEMAARRGHRLRGADPRRSASPHAARRTSMQDT